MSEHITTPAADTGDNDIVDILDSIPMGMPEGMWGLLVTAVLMPYNGGSRPSEFTGLWCHAPQPQAADRTGDVVLRLTEVKSGYIGERVHVDALLAWQGRWQPAGTWRGASSDWPGDVASAVATIVALHTALEQAGTD